jgi:hypothetical protein
MQQDYRVTPLEPGVAVELLPGGLTAPDGLEEAVEAAWAAAQARAGGRLFNGRVFSVTEATPGRITGRLAEYCLAVAAYADAELAAALGIRPLAVCGVLRLPEGVLFGRRTARATYEAGFWQMPPAGSVDAGAVVGDRVDPVRQVLVELGEEIGLPPSRITLCRPFGLVVHGGSGVHDLGLELRTEARFAEVEAAWRAAMWAKPAGHGINEPGFRQPDRPMSAIGG